MSNRQSPEKREDLHFRLLRLLEDHPDYSQRDISRALGISLGRVNYCLKALIDKGLIKVENFYLSRHKLGYLHVLTPQGIAERASLTNRFLRRKMAEYEMLKAEIEALELEVSRSEAPAAPWTDPSALRGG